MALFILNSIQVSKAGDEFIPGGGKKRLILPWDVDQGCLKPMSFKYEVPQAIECGEEAVQGG